MGIGDWGLGIGDWGLGIGPNPQSPIPNPQSPIPNFFFKIIIFNIYIKTFKTKYLLIIIINIFSFFHNSLILLSLYYILIKLTNRMVNKYFYPNNSLRFLAPDPLTIVLFPSTITPSIFSGDFFSFFSFFSFFFFSFLGCCSSSASSFG